MDDQGASLLHIPLKSKQGTLNIWEVRESKRSRKKRRVAEQKKKKTESESRTEKGIREEQWINLSDFKEAKEGVKS